jgi:hypothetical protein
MADAARTQVLALVDAFGEALYGRDLEATMDLLLDGDELTVIPSEGVDVHHGSRAVHAFLERIYAGPRRYGWRWRDRWVTVRGPTAWFVAIGDEIVEAQQSPPRLIPYCLTGCAVRDAGVWRISLLHASEEASR